MGGKRATILVPQGTPIPRWLARRGDAVTSLMHFGGNGRRVCRVTIPLAQVNFSERGAVVLRTSGCGIFRSLFGPGIAFAVSSPKGKFIPNRYLCLECFTNSGRFSRDGNRRKIIVRENGEERVYLFSCRSCGHQYEVSFLIPNGNGRGRTNGNGNGNGSNNGKKHHKKTSRP